MDLAEEFLFNVIRPGLIALKCGDKFALHLEQQSLQIIGFHILADQRIFQIIVVNFVIVVQAQVLYYVLEVFVELVLIQDWQLRSPLDPVRLRYHKHFPKKNTINRAKQTNISSGLFRNSYTILSYSGNQWSASNLSRSSSNFSFIYPITFFSFSLNNARFISSSVIGTFSLILRTFFFTFLVVAGF